MQKFLVVIEIDYLSGKNQVATKCIEDLVKFYLEGFEDMYCDVIKVVENNS